MTVGTKEVVIAGIGALAALAIMFEVWKVFDPGREKPGPVTTAIVVPVLAMALFLSLIVLVSKDAAETAFGAIIILEVFVPFYVVTGRTATSGSRPGVTLWNS